MPTALELERIEWLRYVKAAKKRRRTMASTPQEHREKQHLMAQIRKLAEELKSRFGVRRVVLFGSLTHEAWSGSVSDVDLAVEGLSEDAYWDAWRLAEEMISDRSVDLIELEKASPSLHKVIERYGVSL